MNRDDEIFEALLDLSATAQADYLAQLGRDDPACRERMVALLAGFRAAEDFLEKSPVSRPTAPPEEQPGDQIAGYTLLRKIGEGGCGVVYLAEQSQPVRRRVALKIIKLGMDTLQVVARFEAERQALAMMDHPDIARVFDAGATATGRPYFVMEFVDGVPITKFCDAQSLDMPARLELFARVCVALQHAHQKGIIHRDIKPSNILVAVRDGVPAPKIIDFGIAKATRDRLTEHTLLTAFDQFIGTPAYMSPEQAELRELDIDTRSDVYSLGVLLYELLTGRPPYDPRSLVQAGIEEIRRIIREVDPPRPSLAISTLTAADRTTVAQLRRAAPTRLTSVLRGDLDWIVMRCLEKNRNRRYETANALADDVRRHLRREPVLARPPETLYRAQKFLARNRLACASIAAVSLSLIAGTVVSVRQAIRATRAERVALTERDAATAATAAEAIARADAQRRQAQAEELLTFMLGDFRAELEKIGRLELLDAVGEQAMAYFAELNPRDLTDNALTRQAQALTQIGRVRQDQARYPAALAALQTAFSRAEELSKRHPRDSDVLFERAQAEFWIGFVARRQGDESLAAEWLTRYRDSALGLVALEPDSLRAQTEAMNSQHNLAVLDFDRGNFAAARTAFAARQSTLFKLQALAPQNSEYDFNLADVASWLALTAEYEGDYAQALTLTQEMRDRFGALVTREPKVARWQLKHSQSAASIAGILALQGRVDEALDWNTQAQEGSRALAERDPANASWQLTWAIHRLQRVELEFARHRPEACAPLLAAALGTLTRLVAAEPSSHKFGRQLADAQRWSARLALAQDPVGATALLAAPLAWNRQSFAGGEPTPWDRHDLAQVCVLAGRLAQVRGDAPAATGYWQEAVSALQPGATASHDWRILDPLVQALRLLHRDAEAAPFAQRLHDSGYVATDPLAVALLAAPSPPLDSIPPP